MVDSPIETIWCISVVYFVCCFICLIIHTFVIEINIVWTLNPYIYDISPHSTGVFPLFMTCYNIHTVSDKRDCQLGSCYWYGFCKCIAINKMRLRQIILLYKKLCTIMPCNVYFVDFVFINWQKKNNLHALLLCTHCHRKQTSSMLRSFDEGKHNPLNMNNALNMNFFQLIFDMNNSLVLVFVRAILSWCP